MMSLRLKCTLWVLLLLNGCSKYPQMKLTEIEFSVIDITTGVMDNPASVSLVEIETPPMPFTPLIIRTVDTYSVEYGKTVYESFLAKRGGRYSYYLQFDREGGSFESGRISNGNYYEMKESFELDKKELNVCELKIEPTAVLRFYAKKTSDSTNGPDSVWADLTDGHISLVLGFGRPVNPFQDIAIDVPHGFYTLSESYFKEGRLLSEATSEVYLEHNTDTSIVIEY